MTNHSSPDTDTELRLLVDIVWNHATESTAVPSTKTADALIAKYRQCFPALAQTPLDPTAKGPDDCAEYMLLQARKKGSHDQWTNIYAAQLEQFIGYGCEVRALSVTSTDGCTCQEQHRRGHCTEPGCPYSSTDARREAAMQELADQAQELDMGYGQAVTRPDGAPTENKG